MQYGAVRRTSQRSPGYRDSMNWIYSTPEGLKAYAEFSKLSEGTARRALQEFLPLHAVDPDRISGIDEVRKPGVHWWSRLTCMFRDTSARNFAIGAATAT